MVQRNQSLYKSINKNKVRFFSGRYAHDTSSDQVVMSDLKNSGWQP